MRRSSINAALTNDEVQTVYESLYSQTVPINPRGIHVFQMFRAAAGSEHGLDSPVAQHRVVVDVDLH